MLPPEAKITGKVFFKHPLFNSFQQTVLKCRGFFLPPADKYFQSLINRKQCLLVVHSIIRLNTVFHTHSLNTFIKLVRICKTLKEKRAMKDCQVVHAPPPEIRNKLVAHLADICSQLHIKELTSFQGLFLKHSLTKAMNGKHSRSIHIEQCQLKMLQRKSLIRKPIQAGEKRFIVTFLCASS